jgi:hypothetical protein
MIEFNSKKYYQPIELIDFINDSSSKLSKLWKQKFPKYQQVVLLDQINRVLKTARAESKINFIKFKKYKNSEKMFYGFAVEDVIEYLENNQQVFDIELNKKEK